MLQFRRRSEILDILLGVADSDPYEGYHDGYTIGVTVFWQLQKLSRASSRSTLHLTGPESSCLAQITAGRSASSSLSSTCQPSLALHTIWGLYILYYTILYYTILYSTILYHTLPYSTILYDTIRYYTILYYTILLLYYTILHCRVHYNIV